MQKAHLMIRVQDEVEDVAVMAEEGLGVEVCRAKFHFSFLSSSSCYCIWKVMTFVSSDRLLF